MIVKIKQNPALQSFIRKAFPDYRKHDAIVSKGESVSMSGAHWSGGSRSYYSRVNLSTGNHTPLTGQAWNESVSPVATVEKGSVIAESGIFCGKKATLILTFHPEDYSALGFGS